MRDLSDVHNQFGFHPATSDTGPIHDQLRSEFIAFSDTIWPLLPPGAERTIVFRKLQESLMYANCAVALTAPLVKL